MKLHTEPDYSTDQRRWQAIVHRDRRADGLFICAVKTTGIYCRPSCASRRPNRENVQFFSDWRSAERAGCRACKRCHPRDVSRSQTPPAILQACRLLDKSEVPPKLNGLAQAVGLSPYYLHRLFKEVVGITPKAYATANRRQRFQKGLLLPDQPVTKAVYAAGFRSQSRCYERSAAMLGMTPSKYKKGGEGLTLRYATARSYLGWVLVAATERGISMIVLGDTPQALQEGLLERFPKAELVADNSALAEWMQKVMALIEAPSRAVDLPLDIQGTAFQQRVWKALQKIPTGSTATYAEIARKIGHPTAVRAVANACGSNPVAIVVPCHRVVGSNGELCGYHWGVEKKRALLEREAKAGQRS